LIRAILRAGAVPFDRVSFDLDALRLVLRHPWPLNVREALAARLPEVPHRFDAELHLARALSAAGRTREAQSRLRAIVAEARQKGFVLVEKAALEKR